MKENMADDQIKMIQMYLKKKKRNVAKNMFMNLVHEMISEIQDEITDEEELIVLKSRLDDMNAFFSMIWKNGIEFKDNFMEWRILTRLGWLNWQVKQIDLTSHYFEEWITLTKIYLRKHQKMPEYSFFDNGLRNYFQFLDQEFSMDKALNVVDELLKLSKNHNVIGHLSSVKAGLICRVDVHQSIDLLKKAVWWAENHDTSVSDHNRRQHLVLVNLNIYYTNMLGIAVFYRKYLKDYGRALKWNLKIGKKAHQQIQQYVSTNNFENSPMLQLWAKCLLETATCFIEGFSDAKAAKSCLYEAQGFLKQMDNTFSKPYLSSCSEILKSLFVEYNRIEAMKDDTTKVNTIESKIQNLNHSEIDGDFNQTIENISQLYLEIFQDISDSGNLTIDTKDDLFYSAINGICQLYSNYNLFLEGAAFVKKLSSYLQPYNGKSLAYKAVARLLFNGKYFTKSMRYLKMSAKIADVYNLTESNEHNKTEMKMLWGACFKHLEYYESALAMYLEVVQNGEDPHKLNVASFQVAWCLLKIGRFSESLSWFQKVYNPDQALTEQILINKLICFARLGLTRYKNEDQSQVYSNIWAILTLKMDTWMYHLCKWFEHLREFFVEFAFPLYGSILITEMPKRNESNEEKIKKEMCYGWDLTCNSFYITGFFKNEIVRAKNK